MGAEHSGVVVAGQSDQHDMVSLGGFCSDEVLQLLGTIREHLAYSNSGIIPWFAISQRMIAAAGTPTPAGTAEKWSPGGCQSVWRFCSYPSLRPVLERRFSANGGRFDTDVDGEASDPEEQPDDMSLEVSGLRRLATAQAFRVCDRVGVSKARPHNTVAARPDKRKRRSGDEVRTEESPEPTGAGARADRAVDVTVSVRKGSRITKFTLQRPLVELQAACVVHGVDPTGLKSVLLGRLEGVVPIGTYVCNNPKVLSVCPTPDGPRATYELVEEKHEHRSPRPPPTGRAAHDAEVTVPDWVRAEYWRPGRPVPPVGPQGKLKWTLGMYRAFMSWVGTHRESVYLADWGRCRRIDSLAAVGDEEFERRLHLPFRFSRQPASAARPATAEPSPVGDRPRVPGTGGKSLMYVAMKLGAVPGTGPGSAKAGPKAGGQWRREERHGTAPRKRPRRTRAEEEGTADNDGAGRGPPPGARTLAGPGTTAGEGSEDELCVVDDDYEAGAGGGAQDGGGRPALPKHHSDRLAGGGSEPRAVGSGTGSERTGAVATRRHDHHDKWSGAPHHQDNGTDGDFTPATTSPGRWVSSHDGSASPLRTVPYQGPILMEWVPNPLEYQRMRVLAYRQKMIALGACTLGPGGGARAYRAAVKMEDRGEEPLCDNVKIEGGYT